MRRVRRRGPRLIDAHELAEIDANVRLSDNEAAAIEPAAGYLDAVQVVASFADAARRHGADVRQGVEVKSITVEKGRAIGVETNEGPLACGALVLATGPWAPSLLRPHKVTMPVQGRRAPTALFRRPPDAGRRGLVLADFVQGLYFRPAQGELVQIGGVVADESFSAADPDDYDESAPGDWLPSVRQRLSRRYPALHRAFGRGGFSAVYAATADGHPVVDRLPRTRRACRAYLLPYARASAGDRGNVGAVDRRWTAVWPWPLRLARFEEDDLTKPTWPFGILA